MKCSDYNLPKCWDCSNKRSPNCVLFSIIRVIDYCSSDTKYLVDLIYVRLKNHPNDQLKYNYILENFYPEVFNKIQKLRILL